MQYPPLFCFLGLHHSLLLPPSRYTFRSSFFAKLLQRVPRPSRLSYFPTSHFFQTCVFTEFHGLEGQLPGAQSDFPNKTTWLRKSALKLPSTSAGEGQAQRSRPPLDTLNRVLPLPALYPSASLSSSSPAQAESHRDCKSLGYKMSVMTKSGPAPPLPTTSSPVTHVPVIKMLTFNTILHQKEPGLHAGQLTPPQCPTVARKQH